MNMDCGIPLTSLQVDGGMTINNLLMQLQADILGISVGKTITLTTWFLNQKSSTVEPTVSDHPKYQAYVAAYRRWSYKSR